jgi:hypothetical protein
MLLDIHKKIVKHHWGPAANASTRAHWEAGAAHRVTSPGAPTATAEAAPPPPTPPSADGARTHASADRNHSRAPPSADGARTHARMPPPLPRQRRRGRPTDRHRRGCTARSLPQPLTPPPSTRTHACVTRASASMRRSRRSYPYGFNIVARRCTLATHSHQRRRTPRSPRRRILLAQSRC